MTHPIRFFLRWQVLLALTIAGALGQLGHWLGWW